MWNHNENYNLLGKKSTSSESKSTESSSSSSESDEAENMHTGNNN